MDPQAQYQAPIMNPGEPPKTERAIGPAIGIIIIIIVIVLGGLYFWGQRLQMMTPPVPTQEGGTGDTSNETSADLQSQTQINTIQNQGTDDSAQSIEADLQATDVNSLGSEMNSIEADAQASQ